MDGYPNFDTAYKALLSKVVNEGVRLSPRGLPILELNHITWTLLDTSKDTIDFTTTGFPERQDVVDRYRIQELLWYLDGDTRAKSAPSKFWLKIANEEGLINSNYGHMVLREKKYGPFARLSAFDHVLEILRKDPDSRQAVLHYSEPRHYHIAPKDIPCTVASQVLIRQGHVNMHTFQRSSDSYMGLCYDVSWACWLIQELAIRLGVKAGHFVHTIGSLHIYEKDLPNVKRILQPGTVRQ